MKRKVLITAGSTIVPIDKVRLISNVFSGKTGTAIAKLFAKKGDEVTLVTSSPHFIGSKKWKKWIEKIVWFFKISIFPEQRIKVLPYKTFNQLKESMEEKITSGNYDVVIHSSAVSDYKVSQVCVKDEEGELVGIDAAKKVSSKHEKLYLEMVPTEKLVDLIREQWGFEGKLVKFKLEVGITDTELIEIGKKSRAVSRADLLVANCLEWSGQYAYILDESGNIEKTSRRKLAENLYRKLK